MSNGKENGTIYICTRIFNYSDKIQAEYFETELKRKVNCDIFMPFRDTDENNLVGPNRTKIVYDSDIARLDSGEVILLAVLYDGICKDEGISFEIGYAFGKGIPIYIINTDFIWYSIEGKEFRFDPVIEYMSSGFTQFYKIEQGNSFKDALFNGQNRAFRMAASEISEKLNVPKVYKKVRSTSLKSIDVFIDFGGGRYEYQREYATWIKEELERHNINVEISNRYNEMADSDIYQCGYVDVERVLNTNYFICLGDEIELNAGVAALMGLARCNNKRIILYESSNIEIHGENEHHMKKNLIIDFSIDKVAKSKEEIIKIILEEMNV